MTAPITLHTPAQPLRRTALAVLAVAAFSISCAAYAERVTGSGTRAVEQRTLPPFQAVSLAGSMDLVVRQGATQSVEVEADDNLLRFLETEVRGSGDDARLEVRWKRGTSISTRTDTRIRVTVPQLTALAASGSGDMVVETFETPSLKIRIAGSSDTRLEQLKTDKLEIGISGSGDVAGAGTARSVDISVSGSGDVDLAKMVAEAVVVAIAGSGDARVHATGSLQVRVAGSGDVRYRGDPATVNTRVAGSGSVTKE